MKVFYVVPFATLLGIIIISGCIQQATNKEFSIGYHYTTEGAYFDAQINGSKLVYTHVDSEAIGDRCAQWLIQAPCWTQNDLKTEEAQLTQNEINNLVNLVQETKVMDLESRYGPPEGTARCYPYTLTIKLDSTEKQITYCSNPFGTLEPESFKRVRDKIEEIVNQKF